MNCLKSLYDSVFYSFGNVLWDVWDIFIDKVFIIIVTNDQYLLDWKFATKKTLNESQHMEAFIRMVIGSIYINLRVYLKINVQNVNTKIKFY